MSSLEPEFSPLRYGPGDKPLRPLQIIQAAMGNGVVLFAAVVCFLSRQEHVARAEAEKPNDLLRSLCLLNAGVFCLCVLIAAVVPPLAVNMGALFRRAASASGEGSPGQLAVAFMQKFFKAKMLRLAPLEGSAMMGLVACLIPALDGTLAQNLIYWYNAAPAAVFLAYVIVSFPTAGRIEKLFAAELARARSGLA